MARGRGKKLGSQSDCIVAVGGSLSGGSSFDLDVVTDKLDGREIDGDHQHRMEHALEGEIRSSTSEVANENLGDRTEESQGMQNDDSNKVPKPDAEKLQGTGSKPWSSLFVDNRVKGKESELKFVTPNVSNGRKVVRFHSAEVVNEEMKWKNALLGCVYGLQPRVERITAFAQAR